MAEDTGLISAGLAQANGKLDVIAKNTENIGKAPQKDGLTKSEKDPELTLLDQLFTETKESLGGLSEQFEILNGVFQENTNIGKESAKFAEDTNKAILEELTIGKKAAEIAGVSPSEKNKTKATPTGKPSGVSILKDLSMSDGLGFIALWWKLDEIQGILEDKDGKKKKSGGIGDFFKGLLEGASGIALLAVSLIAFAGALVLFQLVNWPSAIAGMVAFSIFTIGMIGIAKLHSKQLKTFAKFAEASILLSLALAAFGVALWISSALFSGADINYGQIKLPGINIGGAILALVSFAIFEKGVASLAKSLGKDIPDMSKFALGSLIMSGALVAFSMAICISSQIITDHKLKIWDKEWNLDVIAALTALGYFAVFEVIVAGVARIAGSNTPNMVKFAMGSLVMTAALVAFSLSMVFVSKLFKDGAPSPWGGDNLKVDPNGVWLGLAAFGAFLLAVTGIAILAQSVMPNIAMLAGVSVLMSLAMVAFSAAMIFSAVAVVGGDANIGNLTIHAPENSGLLAIASLGVMVAFLLAFAGLGAVIPYVAVVLAIAGVTLLGVSFTIVQMAKAIALTALLAEGGTMEWAGEKFTFKKMSSDEIKLAFMPIVAIVDAMGTASGKIDKGSRKTLEAIANSMVPITESLKNLSGIIENFSNFAGKEKIMDNASDVMNYILSEAGKEGTGFIGMIKSMSKKIKGVKANAVSAAEAMVPVSEALRTILDIIVNTNFPETFTEQINSLNSLGEFMNDSLVPLMRTSVKYKKDIQNAIPILGSKENGFISVVQKIIDLNLVANKISDVNKIKDMTLAIEDIVKGIIAFKEIRSVSILRMNESGVAIGRFSQALDRFDSGKAWGLATSINAIKQSLKDIGTNEDPFIMMSNSISKAADSVDSLNKSLSKTVSHLKDIAKKASKAFDKMKNIEINETTSYSSNGTSSVVGTSFTGNDNLSRILNKWDVEGIPVKGFGKETDEKAMPVKVFSI